MNFKSEIPKFLSSKYLSENSRSAYTYDLKQFCSFFETRELSEAGTTLYRRQLGSLAPSAQRRKISAINQFLAYLYEKQHVPLYLKLSPADELRNKIEELPALRDFSSSYGPIQTPGQFLALLILETGLTPSEINHLKWIDFNWRFNLLEIETGGVKRAIPLQNKFAVRAKNITNAQELFTKSRQYIYTELKKFTPYTARELREQFILRKVKEGATIYDLATSLGLKTVITLERYYKRS